MVPMDPPEGVRRERIEPLWARVDRNRVKLALFVAAYLASIASRGVERSRFDTRAGACVSFTPIEYGYACDGE